MKTLKKMEEELAFFKRLEEKLIFFGNIQHCQNLQNDERFVDNHFNFEEGKVVVFCYGRTWRDLGEIVGEASVPWEGVPYLIGKKDFPVGMATPLQRHLAWRVVERYKKVMTELMS